MEENLSPRLARPRQLPPIIIPTNAKTGSPTSLNTPGFVEVSPNMALTTLRKKTPAVGNIRPSFMQTPKPKLVRHPSSDVRDHVQPETSMTTADTSPDDVASPAGLTELPFELAKPNPLLFLSLSSLNKQRKVEIDDVEELESEFRVSWGPVVWLHFLSRSPATARPPAE